MGFRNPIIVADEISSGDFAGAYTISGSMTIGNPAAAHVIIGTDLHGADGVRIYAADGVTPLIDLNIGGSAIPGSVITGTVANATNAADATNATNLAGGGTASGTTTIAGELIVGNPAAAHVVIGTDGNGADGVRVYAADAVTPLIDLTIAGTPTITSAVLQTGAAGARAVLGPSAGVTSRHELDIFTGDAAETHPGVVYGEVGSGTGRKAGITAQSPDLGHGAIQLSLNSASADGAASPQVTVDTVDGGVTTSAAGDFAAGNVGLSGGTVTATEVDAHFLVVTRQTGLGGTVSADAMTAATAYVATSEGTASTSYTDLTTVGPQVTVSVPPSGLLTIMLSAQIHNNTAGDSCLAAALVHDNTAGTDVQTAQDNYSIVATGTDIITAARIHPVGTLTPGHSVTVTMKYRASAGTATFARRELVVMPSM